MKKNPKIAWLTRAVSHKDRTKCWTWPFRIHNNGGYATISLNGMTTNAAQLALIFDGKPKPPFPNNHALHSCKNNRACTNPDHLRWGSNKDNNQDRIKDGHTTKGIATVYGSLHGNSILIEKDIKEIKYLLSTQQWKQKDIADLFGVNHRTVSNIHCGIGWKHVK